MIKRLSTGFLVLALSSELSALGHAQGSSRVAGGVVQSDEWVVRREKGEEEFRGNVRFDHGPDSAQADWALYRKDLELWNAQGKLHALRRTAQDEVWELWAERADYAMRERLGHAHGDKSPLRFQRAFPTPEGVRYWHGKAQDGLWEGSAKTLTLTGGVRLEGDDLELRSQRAFYEEDARAGRFEGGRPVARFSSLKYLAASQSDALRLTDQPRRIEAAGGVRGWLVLKRRARKP